MHTTNNILGTLQDLFGLKQDLFWRGFKIAVTDCCPSKQDLRNIWEKLKKLRKHCVFVKKRHKNEKI